MRPALCCSTERVSFCGRSSKRVARRGTPVMYDTPLRGIPIPARGLSLDLRRTGNPNVGLIDICLRTVILGVYEFRCTNS